MKHSPLVPSLDRRGVDDEWVREDERKRIAREIHDELGQHLLVLRMNVVILREHTAGINLQADNAVANILRQLDTSMRSVRAIIRGLRPAVLDLGLRTAIEWQCSEITQRGGITCELAWNAGEIAIDDRRATALFRTAQESLTNVYRHAQASRVWINVRHDDGNIIMTVADNGVGMHASDRAKKNAFGLSGIRERIGALGGTLVIHDTAHEGMALTVSLPM